MKAAFGPLLSIRHGEGLRGSPPKVHESDGGPVSRATRLHAPSHTLTGMNFSYLSYYSSGCLRKFTAIFTRVWNYNGNIFLGETVYPRSLPQMMMVKRSCNRLPSRRNQCDVHFPQCRLRTGNTHHVKCMAIYLYIMRHKQTDSNHSSLLKSVLGCTCILLNWFFMWDKTTYRSIVLIL